MKWEEVCQAFPDQSVLIEAIQANTNDESELYFRRSCTFEKVF